MKTREDDRDRTLGFNDDFIQEMRARYPQSAALQPQEQRYTADEIRAFVAQVVATVDKAQAQERAAAQARGPDALLEYERRQARHSASYER